MPSSVETRYARAADGTHVGYQVTGEGPVDLVWVRAWHSNVEHEWDEPVLTRMIRRLGSIGRVIRLDARGTGLSDRVTHRPPPTIEDRVDDIRAVMDSAGSRRAALIGLASGGQLCAMFAAAHPERTACLILYHTTAGRAWGDDSAPPNDPRLERFIDALRIGWGTEEMASRMLASSAPSRAYDAGLAHWLADEQRASGTVDDAIALARIDYETDIRGILPAIHVPTLVLSRDGFPLAGHDEDRVAGVGTAELAPSARAIAAAIPRARLVILPGDDHMALAGDTDTILRAIEEYIEDLAEPVEAEPNRVLATLLFTDIAGSTAMAATLGDRRWADLLAQHHEQMRELLGSYRGHEIDTAGDGFLATFDGPGRAIRCAQAAMEAVAALGLRLRAGLHTGEVEAVGGGVRGIAVHIAARVAALAAPSEVLVSRTVRDLVAGSGFAFEERGLHELRGVPGDWALYAVLGETPQMATPAEAGRTDREIVDSQDAPSVV
jgi:class 3 adenylate cyclase